MRIEKIELQRVQYIPKELTPGVLYVSEEFGAAAHLCACGCGSKVRTPLGPTDWKLEDTADGPTLHPSVGNWQRPCRSHYWIWQGEVQWSESWTPDMVAAGRSAEEERARAYYDALERKRAWILRRFWRWLMALFGQ